MINGSLERSRAPGASQGHATTQVKVVRVNNFVSSDGTKGAKRDNAQSHSPSGLCQGGSGNKISTILQGGKGIKKPLKVINNSKSPYLNNCFTKNGVNQQSTTTNNTDTSSQSSSKAGRKGAVSAEISDSSLNVLVNKKKQGAIATQVKPVNTKLLAAIQRMNKSGVNPTIVAKQAASGAQPSVTAGQAAASEAP